MNSIVLLMLCIYWLVKYSFIFANRVYSQQESDDNNNKMELIEIRRPFFIWGF